MRRGVCAVAGVLACAACGSTRHPAQQWPRHAYTRRDMQLARSFLLRRGDLPGKWLATPRQPAATCPSRDYAGITETARVRSPDYLAGERRVAAFAIVFRTRAQARRALVLSYTQRHLRCADAEARRDARRRRAGLRLAIHHVHLIRPHLARGLTRWSRVIEIAAFRNRLARATIDNATIVRGRLTLVIAFEAQGGTVPTAFEEAVVRRAAARLP